MTTTERYMTDFTTDLHDALDLRVLEDREADSLVDPSYEGMSWVEIEVALDDYAREEALYWDEQRSLLADERYREHYA